MCTCNYLCVQTLGLAPGSSQESVRAHLWVYPCFMGESIQLCPWVLLSTRQGSHKYARVEQRTAVIKDTRVSVGAGVCSPPARSLHLCDRTCICPVHMALGRHHPRELLSLSPDGDALPRPQGRRRWSQEAPLEDGQVRPTLLFFPLLLQPGCGVTVSAPGCFTARKQNKLLILC